MTTAKAAPAPRKATPRKSTPRTRKSVPDTPVAETVPALHYQARLSARRTGNLFGNKCHLQPMPSWSPPTEELILSSCWRANQ
jgi:hypothetical protein